MAASSGAAPPSTITLTARHPVHYETEPSLTKCEARDEKLRDENRSPKG